MEISNEFFAILTGTNFPKEKIGKKKKTSHTLVDDLDKTKLEKIRESLPESNSFAFLKRNELGETLRKQRTKRGLSQKRLGSIVGLSSTTIGKLEWGIPCCSLEDLAKLGEFLGCDVSVFEKKKVLKEPETIGDVVRQKRIELKHTQFELAKLVGTSKGAIGNIERGETNYFGKELLNKVLDFLGIEHEQTE